MKGLPLYKRYVDDILVISRSPAHTYELLATMNNLHPNIRFTVESEKNNQLAFLDISMCRRADGSIQRAIYRKSTWTGQYMHFHSFTPIAFKRGLVRTLFARVRNICTADTLEAELSQLTRTLKENGYPMRFIDRHSKYVSPTTQITTVLEQSVTLYLPYKGDDVSHLIHKGLTSTDAMIYPAASTVIFYRTYRIPTPPVKQVLPQSAESHVIYQYRCGCGASYIGRTER